MPEKDVEKDEEDTAQPMLGVRFKLSCTSTKPVADGRLIPKTAPMTASTSRRMEEDFKLLVQLVETLDKEKGLEDKRCVCTRTHVCVL